MAKKTTKSYIKKSDEFAIDMCDFLENYEGLTYYEAMLLVATPKSQLILDERCVGSDNSLEYLQDTADLLLEDGFQRVPIIKKQTQQQPNEYANNTQEEVKQLIKAFTYLAQKGDKEAQEELIILQKLTTENPKFKIGDNVVVYDTSGTNLLYKAEIKFIDKDGYARLVTDTGLVVSRIITNESTDVKLKTK